jgi:hypothetical protein
MRAASDWEFLVLPSSVLRMREARMRVDDRILKTIVFIGKEAGGRFTPCGTAFVGVVQDQTVSIPLLVTAAHVVDDYFKETETIFVRLNRNNGGVGTLAITNHRLGFRHSDRATDLAILPLPVDLSVFNCEGWSLSSDVLSRRKAEDHWEHGVGDEVVTLGLYTSHYGVDKNIPVVRVGNIAALPDEPVLTRTGYVQAYLIETKSIAGLSGSPVFANLSAVRPRDNNVWVQPSHAGGVILLGVMLGYHVVESAEDQILVPQYATENAIEPDRISAGIDERNTGFAVVVPIERVFEIVRGEEMQTALRAAVEAHLARSGYRQY